MSKLPITEFLKLPKKNKESLAKNKSQSTAFINPPKPIAQVMQDLQGKLSGSTVSKPTHSQYYGHMLQASQSYKPSASVKFVSSCKKLDAVYEKKLKASAEKLKKAYAAELAKKHCSQIISLEDRPQIIVQVNKPEKPKTKKEKKEKKSSQVCKATKCNGTKCTAKAKNGEFCGRHKK